MDDQLIIDKNTKAISESVKATKQLKEKEEKEDAVPAANEQCIANRSIHFGLGNEDKGWGRPNNLRALVEHINKGMLTIKSDTVFTENDIITGLDKAGYVRKTLADPLADVSTAIQNHLLTTVKGRKFEVCATGDKSVASVIG